MYRDLRGFTVIELLVAMTIFVVVSLGASWILITSLRANGTIWEQLQTQNEGRKVLQQVVDDVRRAEESSLGSYQIVIVEENNLIFYANIDDDSYRERIHFWLDGEVLKKGILKPSGNPLSYSGAESVVEIAHDVKNIAQSIPVFSYYDENFTGTENPIAQPVGVTAVRLVKVQLELEKDPTATPVPLHIETIVHIRSLKTE